jgi:hypothetical protein
VGFEEAPDPVEHSVVKRTARFGEPNASKLGQRDRTCSGGRGHAVINQREPQEFHRVVTSGSDLHREDTPRRLSRSIGFVPAVPLKAAPPCADRSGLIPSSHDGTDTVSRFGSASWTQ